MVHAGDRGINADTGGQVVAADGARDRERALGGVQHGPDAQRLGDDGVEVVLVVGIVAQAGEDVEGGAG